MENPELFNVLIAIPHVKHVSVRLKINAQLAMKVTSSAQQVTLPVYLDVKLVNT
jgi:hypothetical protein